MEILIMIRSKMRVLVIIIQFGCKYFGIAYIRLNFVSIFNSICLQIFYGKHTILMVKSRHHHHYFLGSSCHYHRRRMVDGKKRCRSRFFDKIFFCCGEG
mmetsp:Transcript_8051/g.16483  ORF Transcript_8051/g.16483 Transcript_8051/m.16483 type:complete len:99 (-) Transcript_8051:98-394(-)